MAASYMLVPGGGGDDIPAEYAKIFDHISKTPENIRYIRYVLSLSLHDYNELMNTPSLDKKGGEFFAIRMAVLAEYLRAYIWRSYFEKYVKTVAECCGDSSLMLRDAVFNARKTIEMMQHETRRTDQYYSLIGASRRMVEIDGFALLYCVVGGKKTRYAFMYAKLIRGIGNVFQGYAACVGHGILSLDGEYRPTVLDEKHISDSLRMGSAIFDDMLQMAIETKFASDVFPPASPAAAAITDSRIDINTYMIAVFVRYMQRKLSLRDFSLADAEDRDILSAQVVGAMNKIAKHHGDAAMIDTYRYITFSERTQRGRTAKLGQKLVPLPVADGRSVMNIVHRSWREIHINNELTTLFLNYVAHSFPLIHSWFILDAIDDRMFGKYDSEHYAAILGDSIVSDSKRTHAPGAGRFLEASMRTNVSGLVIMLEHVGDPVKSLAYLHGSKYYMDNGPFLFARHENVESYLFILTYTLLAMNTRIGVIHCDLHLNNVIVEQPQPEFRGRANIYHAHGELYAPPAVDLNAYIIDFSRAMIAPKMETASFEAQNAETMLFYYNKLFPDERQIAERIARNHDAMYVLFAAIDMYMHTTRLAAFMNEHRRAMKIPDESMRLVEAIRADAAAMLVEEPGGEAPNKRILDHHFAHMRIGAADVKKIKNLGTVYSLHNELKRSYRGTSEEFVPGLMKNFDDDFEAAFMPPIESFGLLLAQQKTLRNTIKKNEPRFLGGRGRRPA